MNTETHLPGTEQKAHDLVNALAKAVKEICEAQSDELTAHYIRRFRVGDVVLAKRKLQAFVGKMMSNRYG